MKKLFQSIDDKLKNVLPSISWHCGYGVNAEIPYGVYRTTGVSTFEYFSQTATSQNGIEAIGINISFFDTSRDTACDNMDLFIRELEVSGLQLAGEDVIIATKLDSKNIEIDPDYMQDGQEVWFASMIFTVQIYRSNINV